MQENQQKKSSEFGEKCHKMLLGMKWFVLARFGSKKSCTFAPPKAQAVYAI